jgi:hypothetical protein
MQDVENTVKPIGNYSPINFNKDQKEKSVKLPSKDDEVQGSTFWCFKAKRSERYGVEQDSFKEFDEKKFVDMRFWLFMGVISNINF